MLTDIVNSVFVILIFCFLIAIGVAMMFSRPTAKRLAMKLLALLVFYALTLSVVNRISAPVVITLWLITSPIAYAIFRRRLPQRRVEVSTRGVERKPILPVGTDE